MQYIAFLRGINIGKRQVKMEDLQNVFEKEGFTNVITLIASGNVIFESNENNEEKLRESLENLLERRFVFSIPVILRSQDDIKKLLSQNPFRDIKVEAGMRLQITLFNQMTDSSISHEQNGFKIIYVGKREVTSVVYPDGKTTELMTFIDKAFGKNSTTRNWNTIQKLILV